MTREDSIVYGATPAFGQFGEPAWKIARRAELPWTTVQVILEHVLLVCGMVRRAYIDRSYLWSRTPPGDREATRHGR